jgi:peptide/nickel transport system substrate-binding protein
MFVGQHARQSRSPFAENSWDAGAVGGGEIHEGDDGTVAASGARLAVYLFADVRGYTAFTERYGAQAAGAMTERLFGHARDVAGVWRGELRGTWGDQVLLVFGSARDGVSASLDLLARVSNDAAGPLEVGAGLDVGEPAWEIARQATPALNRAARLCARAAAGEVLTTREVAQVAGRMPGIAFADRGRVALKGISERTPLVAIVPEASLRRRRKPFRRLEKWFAARPRLAVASIVVTLTLVAGLLVWQRPWQSPPGPLPPGAVAVLDHDSGDLKDAVGLGKVSAGAAVGRDAFWVTEPQNNIVTRVDLKTMQTQAIPVDAGPVAVAITATDAWVAASASNMVTRVNTDTGQAADHVAVGAEPRGIAIGFNRVWVTSQLEDSVTVLDATTGKKVGTVDVGAGPVGITTGLGFVWVANAGENTVSRISPTSMTVDASYPVGSGPTAVATGAGSVWVVNRLGLSVTRIDPTRTRDPVTIGVGDSPEAIAADDSGVWVGNLASGTVSRIDPATDQVVRTFPLGASPTGLAVSDKELWTATTSFAAPSHYGGTLTVGEGVSSIDPQVSGDIGALELVYDGLVGQQRTGGPGYGLTPNLAVALPVASADVKTWQVTLRHGVRYSDGRQVLPADFRRGIERVFSLPGAWQPDFSNIVGSERCTKPLMPCDLSQGIVTTSDSITFHLSSADPDFANKLALPAAVPVPPGVDPYSSKIPIPGTGPYRVQSFTPSTDAPNDPAGLLVLTRNPAFRTRSAAAKQRGYADVVRFVETPAGLDEAGFLARGLDAVIVNFHRKLQGLATRYPQRFRSQSVAGTHYVVLDTHSRPFSDARAREAVAFALDRAALSASLLGQHVVCHINPPGYPGSGSPCQYTAHPGESATWTGPDIDRAKKLVLDSGTRGEMVNIYLPDGPGEPDMARSLVQTLQQIGYHPVVHNVGQDDLYAKIDDPKVDMQLTWTGYGVEFPGWSQFYLSTTRCTPPSGPSRLNRRYCNLEADRLAIQALQQELTDRHLAWKTWSSYFDAIEQDAAIIAFDTWHRDFLVSARVGNVQLNSFWGLFGLFYEQLWVK